MARRRKSRKAKARPASVQAVRSRVAKPLVRVPFRRPKGGRLVAQAPLKERSPLRVYTRRRPRAAGRARTRPSMRKILFSGSEMLRRPWRFTRCGQRWLRRQMIIATGFGGRNGARRYKERDMQPCR